MPLFKSALANPENEVIIYDERPHPEDVIEMHQPEVHQFNFPSLPEENGSVIEVTDEPHAHHTDKEEGPKDRWDWQAGGMSKLLEWSQDRLNSIPDMQGNETTALERGISYLKRFNGEISKAISSDYDGEIDVKAIEQVRAWIFKSIKKLEKILKSRHEHYSKKDADTDTDGGMVKEARTPYNGGIIVTVPLIISRCARVCINGAVSAGHDLPDLYHEQVKKYSLDKREQAELIQHLEDMGFPIRADRLMLPDEEVVVENGRGDLASNYYA